MKQAIGLPSPQDKRRKSTSVRLLSTDHRVDSVIISRISRISNLKIKVGSTISSPKQRSILETKIASYEVPRAFDSKQITRSCYDSDLHEPIEYKLFDKFLVFRDSLVFPATIMGQDIEVIGERYAIARRVAKDRVISSVDPDARHMFKSSASRFDGCRSHIAIDPDSEVITADTVTPIKTSMTLK